MKKYLYIGAAFNAAILLAALLFAMVKQSTLIITMGVVLAGVARVGGWIVIALLFAAGNFLWILRLRKLRGGAAPSCAQPLELSRKERIDPEQIRGEFLRFSRESPVLQDQIAEALAQLDSMNRKQAKLGEIFHRNQVHSLDEIDTTIDGAEQAMCLNMVKVINRVILWDPLEANKPGKESIYAGHLAYVQNLLARNDEILSKCDILLAETVGYIDEKNSDEDSGRLHLEVMTETIQSLRQINIVEP